MFGACSESVGGLSGSARGVAAAVPEAIRSLDDVAEATKRRTTSRLTLCDTQIGTSDRLPHPTYYFR